MTYRIYTEDKNREDVIRIVNEHSPIGATIIPCIGIYDGKMESALIIEIVDPDDPYMPEELAQDIKKFNDQDSVLVVSCGDEGDVRMTKIATKYGNVATTVLVECQVCGQSCELELNRNVNPASALRQADAAYQGLGWEDAGADHGFCEEYGLLSAAICPDCKKDWRSRV